MKARPPLPGGPYLVVGLARSGVAAALALRARGEEVIGCDAGASRRSGAARGRRKAFARRASKFTWMRQATPLPPSASQDAHQEPRRTPERAPLVRRRERAAISVLGEVELAWRLVENEFVAVTGTNGKTTTTEWIGHIHREAGLPVEVAGNVGTAASSLVGRIVRATRRSSARSRRFSSRTRVAFAPEVAVLLNLAPDHLDRYTAVRGLRGGEAARSSPTRATTTMSRSRPTTSRIDRARRLRPAGAVRLGIDRRRRRLGRRARRTVVGRSAAAGRRRDLAARASTTRTNAMAAAAACLARGIEPRGGRRRACGPSPASPTGSS